LNHYFREPGSSVSIVSGYGLDDWAIGVRSPAEAKDFSSNLCVQSGSGAHPASCATGTGGPFPGGKTRPGRDADHSPHLVPSSIMSRSYTSSSPRTSMACSGTALALVINERCTVQTFLFMSDLLSGKHGSSVPRFFSLGTRRPMDCGMLSQTFFATVRLFGGCAARSRKRGNRRCDRA
jgi:hypothetical protein